MQDDRPEGFGVARLCGACCGLLVFSAVNVCGVMAGNPPERTLLRALVALGGGYTLGAMAGWIGLRVVQDAPRPATPILSARPETPKPSPEAAS